MKKSKKKILENSFYRFRLIFCFSRTGVVTPREGEKDEPIEMKCDSSNGQEATFGSIGLQPLSQTDEFEVSLGGFEDPQKAWNSAQELSTALLILSADQEIGVDIGKIEVGEYSESKGSQGQSNFNVPGLEELSIKERKQIISYKRGITIVKQPSADYGYKTIGIKGTINLTPFSTNGIWNAWLKIVEKKFVVEKKTSLALELYNSAFFENSMRAKFLTWMLMLESLSKPLERSQRILDLISKMEELIKFEEYNWEIEVEERDMKSIEAIKTNLNFIKKESITQSLKKMAREKSDGITFAGYKAEKFIGICYNIRSSLVHDGETKVLESEFNKIVYALQAFCIHVIRKTINIDHVEIPEEWRGQTIINSNIVV